MRTRQLLCALPLVLAACGSTLSATARQAPPAPMTKSEPLYVFRTNGDYQFISGARFERQAGDRVRFYLMWSDPDPRYVDPTRWDIVLIDGTGRRFKPVRLGHGETVRLMVQYIAGEDSRYARRGPPYTVDDGPLHPVDSPPSVYNSRRWVEFQGVPADANRLKLEVRRHDLDGDMVLAYSWHLDRFWPTEVHHHGRPDGLRHATHLVPGPTTRAIEYVDPKTVVVEPFRLFRVSRR